MFSESNQENLQIGLLEDYDKMEEATKLAVIYDKIKVFENEYDILVDPRGMKLPMIEINIEEYLKV